MELDQLVEQLEQYALDNYNAGGHWAYETFGRDEYVEILQQAITFDEAKAFLKAWCKRTNEREMDCSWDGPPEGYTRPVWKD